jgi:hypothetical protein
MSSATELESYMDKMEERYFAMHPDPKSGHRRNWAGCRKYIVLVKKGRFPGITPETSMPQLAVRLLGLRRAFGEEIHPRRRIRKRQMAALVALNNQPADTPGEIGEQQG